MLIEVQSISVGVMQKIQPMKFDDGVSKPHDTNTRLTTAYNMVWSSAIDLVRAAMMLNSDNSC